MQIHRRLQVRALEWERGNKDNSFLLRGTDLQDAEAQLVANAGNDPKATNLQTKYVLKSRQATDKQRRITTGIAIVGVIVLAVLAVFGFVQANLATSNSIEAQNQAETAQAAYRYSTGSAREGFLDFGVRAWRSERLWTGSKSILRVHHPIQRRGPVRPPQRLAHRGN